MKLQKMVVIGAALSAGLVFVGMSNAGVISQALDYGPGLSPLTNPFTQVMNFNEFQSSLGTLTSVTVQIGDTSSGSVQVTNNSTKSSDYSISLGEQLALKDPSSTVLASFLDQSSPSSATIASGNSDTINTTASGASPVTTLSSNLSQFIGSGQIALLLSGSGVALVSGATPYSAATNSTSLGVVTLDYNYANAAPTGAPLPGSGALALMGGVTLIGTMAIRRRAVR